MLACLYEILCPFFCPLSFSFYSLKKTVNYFIIVLILKFLFFSLSACSMRVATADHSAGRKTLTLASIGSQPTNWAAAAHWVLVFRCYFSFSFSIVFIMKTWLSMVYISTPSGGLRTFQAAVWRCQPSGFLTVCGPDRWHGPPPESSRSSSLLDSGGCAIARGTASHYDCAGV